MERGQDPRRFAERHHGLVGRDRLREAGLTWKQLATRVKNGDIAPVGAGAFRYRGAPINDHARALASVWNTQGDTYLSHTTAAWLWGVPGFTAAPIHVARPFQGPRGPAAADFVHNLRGIPIAELGELEAIPVASPSLTVFQLAAVCHPGRTERALDNLLSTGLTTPDRMHRLLRILAARGRNGIRVMRKLLAERPLDYRPPESNNERRFQAIARGLGVELERQINIGGDRFVTRVDFRDPDHPHLVYRINSERWHTAVSHRADDQLQADQLVAGGFEVVDIWDTDIWADRVKVEGQIIAARTAAGSPPSRFVGGISPAVGGFAPTKRG